MAVLTYDRPSRSPAFSAPAIVAGAIGVIMALSPNVRGGIASIVSILAGVVGILAAVVKIFVH